MPKSDVIEGHGNGYNIGGQDLFMVSGQGSGGVFKALGYAADQSAYSADGRYSGIIGVYSGVGDGSIGNEYQFSSYFNDNPTFISPKYEHGMTFKMMTELAGNYIDQMPFSYPGSSDYTNLFTYNSGTLIDPIIGVEEGSGLEDKLQGFVLRDQEGKTYYYTLPLYTWQRVSYVNATAEPPLSADGSFSAIPDQTHSYSVESSPFATTWLLTAITGPDYVKMSCDRPDYAILSGQLEQLMPHYQDLGYWVKFNYAYGCSVSTTTGLEIPSKQISKATYLYRTPFFDATTPSMYHVQTVPGQNQYSSSYGMKEITYLKSIETAAEVAYFRTSPRMDGYGIEFANIGDNIELRKRKYPDFAATIIQTEVTGWLPNHGDMSIAEALDLRKSDPTPDTYEPFMTNCIKVDIPNTIMTAADWRNSFAEGTPLGRIVFESTRRWYNEWNHTSAERTEQFEVEIIKDTYGCDIAAGKISTQFNRTIQSPHVLKCMHALDIPNNITRLYMVASKELPASKSVFYFPRHFEWEIWMTPVESEYKNLRVKGVVLGPGGYIPNRGRNAWVKHCKRLDEIAWYSRSKYPYLIHYHPILT